MKICLEQRTAEQQAGVGDHLLTLIGHQYRTMGTSTVCVTPASTEMLGAIWSSDASASVLVLLPVQDRQF